MKRFVTTIFTLLTISLGFAQENEIIYTDFVPDSVKVFNYSDEGHNILKTDMDNDGVEDFYFQALRDPHAPAACVCLFTNVEGSGPNWLSRMAGICDYGDTLNPQNVYSRGASFCWYHENPEETKYVGIRILKDNGDCYGWVELNIKWDSLYAHRLTVRPILTVKCMAYCTIPDYPLRAGQTSLVWGINENESIAFATIHPNPTKGMATAIGRNLKQAEVINILGQRVTTVQGKGETMQINISNLPAGVYFVFITNEEGQKCVRKIMKE